LWGWDTEGRKIAWIKWDNLCKPKAKGGLGIKQIDIFNKALLGKWKWRLGSLENCLWKDILASKYGSWRNLSESKVSKHASRWWFHLNKVCEDEQGINWFDSNMEWAVGSSEKVKLWEDVCVYIVWVYNCQLKARFPRLFNNSLIIDNSLCRFGNWNRDNWVEN